MRAFVTLLVPAVSLLAVNAASISNGVHGLVARRQFHNADFNSGSGHHGHHHGEHDDKESSSDPVSRRQLPVDPSSLVDTSKLNIGLPSDAVARRQLPSPVGDLAAQATTLAGSTPAGGVLGTVSSTASRRQDVDPSDVTSLITDAVESTPAGGVVGGASSTTSRRQVPDVSGVSTQASNLLGSAAAGSVTDSLTGAAFRRQTTELPDIPVIGEVSPGVDTSAIPLNDIDLNDATDLSSLTSSNTTTRALKDVAEEDIVAADEDIDTADEDIEEDLKEVPPPLDVVPGYAELSPELPKESESESASAAKDKRQTDVSTLAASLLDQELVESLTTTNATGQA